MMYHRSAARTAFILAALAAPPAHATWSIIIIDTATKEIGVASATCLVNFDLRRGLPVVRVGVGAGCAQSSVDASGANRMLIWNDLAAGVPPATILQHLQQQDGAAHQTRQYGIADVLGRTVTFSGAQNGAYANGVTGSVGSLVYAIQGNVITGQPVIDEAQYAVINTPGGIPDKLMAAMQAARAMGGDGRCSCNPGDADACGSPPNIKFTHTAYIGFVIVARRGDVDGACTAARGCASGTYYLNLNFPLGSPFTPDPVFVLQQQFNNFRAGRIGVPDAVESRATFSRPSLANVPGQTATLTIELLDWQGLPATTEVYGVEVTHDSQGSAGSSTIGRVQSIDSSLHTVEIDAGSTVGLDRFAVKARDALGTRYLIPSPTLRIYQPGDMDCDGAITYTDLDGFLLALFNPPAYVAAHPDCVAEAADVNLDGGTDLLDVDAFLICLRNEVCP